MLKRQCMHGYVDILKQDTGKAANLTILQPMRR